MVPCGAAAWHNKKISSWLFPLGRPRTNNVPPIAKPAEWMCLCFWARRRAWTQTLSWEFARNPRRSIKLIEIIILEVFTTKWDAPRCQNRGGFVEEPKHVGKMFQMPKFLLGLWTCIERVHCSSCVVWFCKGDPDCSSKSQCSRKNHTHIQRSKFKIPIVWKIQNLRHGTYLLPGEKHKEQTGANSWQPILSYRTCKKDPKEITNHNKILVITKSLGKHVVPKCLFLELLMLGLRFCRKVFASINFWFCKDRWLPERLWGRNL